MPSVAWTRVVAIGVCAALGVLVRSTLKGLVQETRVGDSTRVLFDDLNANVLGSWVLGALTVLKQRGRVQALVASAVGTGFCGSLTTLSAWIQHTAAVLVTGDVMAAWINVMVGMLGCVAAFRMGMHSATLWLGEEQPELADVRLSQEGHVKDRAPEGRFKWILAAAATVALTGIMFAFGSTQLQAFSLLCAPFGAWVRWKVGEMLNKDQQMPMGTLVVNVAGTVMLAVLSVAYVPSSGKMWAARTPGSLDAFVLGVGVGFCGAVTTVSSVVGEVVVKLQDMALAGRYVTITLATTLSTAALVNGLAASA